MALKSEMERQGNWLFRWRSYVPLIGAPAAIAAVSNMSWPFGSFAFHEVWEWFCLGLSVLGLVIRVITVGHAPAGTSGRNTEGQTAWSLTTTGAYSVARHPLYFGNYLIGLGAAMVPFVWWFPLLYSAAYWLYYERIMLAEEAFLEQQFGDTFVTWAEKTPAFVPRLSLWQRAAAPFSLRFVLRKEYTALAMVVLLHGGIELTEHWEIEHRFVLEPMWAAVFAVGLATYVVLRGLKKHTHVLDVADR